jgi:putative membrane protein
MSDRGSRGILIAVLILLLFLAAVPWLIGWSMFGMPRVFGGAFSMRRPFGVLAFAFGGLVRLALLALAVALVFVILRPHADAPRPAPPESPQEILKRRYAAGELTREQFDQMRQDLRE